MIESGLFIVTGASGTGKTTLVPLLKKQLGSTYAVHDFDAIWKPYDFTDDWDTKVIIKGLVMARQNAKEDRFTVVAGLIRPQKVKKLAKKLDFSLPIHFCLLDVSPEARARRLKERKASEELIKDEKELEMLPKWFRDSGYKYFIIDTTQLSIGEVANEIVKWIKGKSK